MESTGTDRKLSLHRATARTGMSRAAVIGFKFYRNHLSGQNDILSHFTVRMERWYSGETKDSPSFGEAKRI
jgi:hypothetical protein